MKKEEEKNNISHETKAVIPLEIMRFAVIMVCLTTLFILNEEKYCPMTDILNKQVDEVFFTRAIIEAALVVIVVNKLKTS